jgi:hypothetical protein
MHQARRGDDDAKQTGRKPAAWLEAAALSMALLVVAGSASAQQPLGEPPAATEGKACFQPRPLPMCRSFWITEFGIQYFVSQPPGVNNQRHVLFTWEVGWMQNRTPADALGGSVFIAVNDHVLRSGVSGRYRRWTGAGTAVDLSPGLILLQSDENLEVRTRLGAALQAGVTYHDWIALTTQVEAVSSGVRFQAGVRLGGYPGAVTGIGLPVLAVIAEGKDES